MKKRNRDTGKNIFQAISIKKSYRNRGRVPRTHIKKNENIAPKKIKIRNVDGKKSIDVKNLINNILPYSDKNRKVNSKAENSMLKPETNSLSPSAKSKGARLVSARHEIIHIPNIGNIKSI